VIATLRWVKCPSRTRWTWTSRIMKKPTANRHKAQGPSRGRPGAPWPRAGGSRPVLRSWCTARAAGPWRARGTPVAGRRSPWPARVPEQVFAPVCPGFVAACMVEAADPGGRRYAGPRARRGSGDRRPGRFLRAGGRPPGAARQACRPRTPHAGGRRIAGGRSRPAVLCTLKQTNGIFYPGGRWPSRRCSARRGYHCARACQRLRAGIGYFE
jgi:hypothetical protein